MKITGLSCHSRAMRLREPYTIAYETVDHCENVFLRMETDMGITGMGCAAPDLPVTGETPEGVLDFFREVIEPLLMGCDPFEFARIMEDLKSAKDKNPSALAMVDMALYDLMAKKAGVPLYKLLGGFRHSIPTSITIGILPVSETLAKARQFLKQGFTILKLKGGADVDEDIEKVIRIREISNIVEIRFDANQGYGVKDALRFIEETRQARIELLEQPTDKMNEDLLKQVSQHISVPVMADESLMTLKDVFRLTSNEATDMINIKLMKVGGITEALHINSVAKAAGVEAMVGCMDESALGIHAGLHFALSRPNIAYADLDGHLDLEGDPFEGLFRLEEGILYPGDFPGLSRQ
jgi:L-alanine-DL-glutamate epimerase-like enolase superfamily enzyme